MQTALAIGLILFFALMVGISLWAGRRIHTGEDFIVAGRGLSGLLTTATIMATWYAAETILITADWVRTDGIKVIVLEPLGIGLCLVLTGWFYARRVWETKQCTLADIIRSRFGPVAEKLQALISIGYIGWVAVQLIGLAGVFHVFFDIPISTAVILLSFVLTLYTLIGGMWSVAMTDIIQLGMLLLGIMILALKVLAELGGDAWSGLAQLFRQLDADILSLVPVGAGEELRDWIGLIVLGLVANIATQDLLQRVFAARSADTAARSCIAAGVLYIVFGMFPVLLGLCGILLIDSSLEQGVIPALAEQFLSPTMAVVFALTLTAAVTSSVDSGLLAPAAVLSRNILEPLLKGRIDSLLLTRISVVAIAIGSTALALSGTRASELIQGNYALGLPALVLLTAALFQKRTHPLPGVLTLSIGIVLWLVAVGYSALNPTADEDIFPAGFPAALLLICIAVYWLSDRLLRPSRS